MAKLARRTNSRTIDFADLSGGINVSKLPDVIADNEMQVCNNFLYGVDSKILQKRGGLSSPFATYPSDILKTYYDFESNRYLVFLKSGNVYASTNFGSAVFIGILTGSSRPMCTKFQNKVWIASGGHLQYFDGNSSMVTVNDSPLADFVIVREGRIVCFRTRDDMARYSGMGDGTFWEEDPNDDSSASWVEIGYGDSGDLLDAVFMANDIFFFKSNGFVYKLSGEYPDWTVELVSEKADLDTRMCACNIGNDVVFVGRRGLKSLNSTSKYVEIESADIGDKFNKLITDSYYQPRVWNLTKYHSLFINPNCGNVIVVYNYDLKACTTLSFPFEVVDVFETLTGVVVVSPRSLYRFSREYLTDNGDSIPFRIVTKRYITIYNRMLVSMVDVSVSSSTSGEFSVDLNNLSLTVPNLERKNFKINYSVPFIELEISGTDDLIFNRISLEVTDI